MDLATGLARDGDAATLRAMRVHHLSCGTMCPMGGRHLDGRSGSLFTASKLVCHVLLVETDRDGLLLVDTGFGRADLADPAGRLGRAFPAVARPVLLEAETAHAHVQALGFDPADVRHIVLTHMDLDHAGGLSDFPNAAVHLLAAEHHAATVRPTGAERNRYRPGQWAHGARFETYEASGEPWFGFRAVRALRGLPEGDVLLVPLLGHSRGHCGVAVRSGDRWLLHCGDAYFHEREVLDPPSCPRALAFFQRLVAFDYAKVVHNKRRLVELARTHGAEVSLFSAHDEAELDRLAALAG